MHKSISKASIGLGGGDILKESPYPDCDEKYDTDRMLQEAEQKFVRNDLTGALDLANQVLQVTVNNVEQDSRGGKNVQLRTLPPYFEEQYQLSLLLSTPSIDAAARASAIVLQSINSDNDNAHLHRVLQCYSTRPMPLDLMTILIQFLLHSGYNLVAMELAVEVLHIVKSSSVSSTTDIDESAFDELIWLIFTKMLPYCPNESYSECFNNDDYEWQSAKATGRWSKEPIPSILSMLPIVLDSWKDLVSDECLRQCHDRIRELRGGSETNEANEGQEEIQRSGIIPRKPSNGGFFGILNRRNWYQQLANRFLQVIRSKILQPLSDSENKWQKRSAVAMTVLSLYIAWKQRRRTMRATKVIAALLLEPLKEIVDAVLEA